MVVRIRPYLDIQKISKAMACSAAAGGQAIKEFEAAFASWLGASNAIAVDRGRSALLLALKILGIGEGDEVIVQSYIFHVVIDAILEMGARPVLVDSGLEDFNISTPEIEKAITRRTKAIIVTHLGVPCDMEEITGIVRRHGCYLIENCAHTLGAEFAGTKTGNFGDMSFFSFDVDKPLSTGDGGMLVINNKTLLEKAHGVLDHYRRVPLEREKPLVYGLILHHFVTGDDIYPEKVFLPVDFGKRAVMDDPRLLSLVESASAGSKGEFHDRVLPYLRQKHLSGKKPESAIKRFVSRISGRARSVFGPVSPEKIDAPHLLMNSMRSTVGAECLKDYGECKAARDRNVQYYAGNLDPVAFGQPLISKEKKPAFIRYAVLNRTRYANSFISSSAREKGFEIGIFNWSDPIHRCYTYDRLLRYDRSRLRNSELLGGRLLSLPVHPYLGEQELKKITGFLNGLAI